MKKDHKGQRREEVSKVRKERLASREEVSMMHAGNAKKVGSPRFLLETECSSLNNNKTEGKKGTEGGRGGLRASRRPLYATPELSRGSTRAHRGIIRDPDRHSGAF